MTIPVVAIATIINADYSVQNIMHLIRPLVLASQVLAISNIGPPASMYGVKFLS